MTNINANLNLAESISDFISTVQRLLEITEVAKWDGNTVEREERIREAALILAGQCIALLLYNLSQLPEAQAIAKEKTQGWYLGIKVRHLTCWREILTVGNVIVRLKLVYVLKKRPRTGGKIKKINQGFCLWLRWLGIVEGVSPLTWATVAKFSTTSSSFEMARFTANRLGNKVKRQENRKANIPIW